MRAADVRVGRQQLVERVLDAREHARRVERALGLAREDVVGHVLHGHAAGQGRGDERAARRAREADGLAAAAQWVVQLEALLDELGDAKVVDVHPPRRVEREDEPRHTLVYRESDTQDVAVTFELRSGQSSVCLQCPTVPCLTLELFNSLLFNSNLTRIVTTTLWRPRWSFGGGRGGRYVSS